MNDPKLTRLPPGRHGLSRDIVVSDQRGRLIDAFARVVAERGFRATTIADITSLASVSRNVFYEQFGGKDECFVATFEVVRAHVGELIAHAAAPFPERPEQLVASLRAFLSYFAVEPGLGRLCFLEPLSAGPAMTACYEGTLAALVAQLHGMATDLPDERPSQTDRVLVLGAISLLRRRISLGESESLADLSPELAHILLTPYFGEDAIRELVKRVVLDA